MSAQHTPGPWEAFFKHKYDEWHVSIPMSDGGMRWALFDDGVRSENPEGDARLIAAAPELLAALRAMLDANAVPSSICKQRPAYDAARAAISKATGSTS